MKETNPIQPCSVDRTYYWELQRGAKTAVPILIGFVPFGLVLGAQASEKGLSPLLVALMTGTNFGGGSEFAAIELWSEPPHMLPIVLMTILVNSRHILMGAVMSPYLQHLPIKRALASLFFMCDESWAVAIADARGRKATPSFSLAFFIGLSVCLWLTWVFSTTLGAIIGPLLGNLRSYGFDMAFAAVFFVLLRGMWKGPAAAMPWAASLGTAVVFYAMVPGGWYVLAGALAGLIWAYLSVIK